MDMIKTKEKQLLEKLDQFIAAYDRDGLYMLEQNSIAVVLKNSNPIIRKTLIICAAEREESVYLENTIFSTIDFSLAESPTFQLSKKYDEITRYLLRFANDFPEDYLQEGIDYFLENNISGDLLATISIAGDIKPQKILPDIAMRLLQHNISATLRIYKALQLKYKKAEHFIAAALIYMELGNFETAYKVLNSSEEKSIEIEKVMNKIKPHLE